ncbi:ricin-type beta-trefoil lectin domain protein [Streptomyces sp. NPDC048669]|uniref:RICIN domain-containing protein n=1 Tax=Streptomyces sp. NPDC048669 TaxID=3155267 RepID=UPI00342AE295
MNVRKGIGSLAATAGAAALLVTGMTTPAHAAGGPNSGTYRLQNAQTGRCLNSTGPFTHVTTTDCKSTDHYQHWSYTRINGRIQLKNTGSGRCLKPTNAFSKELTTAPCGIDDNDYWNEEFIDAKARLISAGGNAVDADAKGNAYLNPYGSNNPYQQWYLTFTMPG